VTDGAREGESARPRIAVFALGGTIAAPAATEGATITLGADSIVGTLPETAGVDVDAQTFRRLPSASLTLADLVELADEVRRALESDCAGVVVAAGTDTMEEIAMVLDALHSADGPVVVTGAMRNAGLPGADGPANLLAALRVAAAPDARRLGCLVVSNDQIHLAQFARKAHSSSPAAFESANVGPIGWLTEARVRIPLRRGWRRLALDLDAVASGLDAGGAVPVALHRCTLGEDAAVYPALAATGVGGLVIETFGAGHVPAASMDAIREVAAEIPVVFVTRTGSGDLYRSVGAFRGSERDLLEAGLIPADAYDGPKARMVLQLLLCAGARRSQIEEAFGAR
jgi:L-asparaginase